MALFVIADGVAHSIRELTADRLIVKVIVQRWLNPLTRLRVTDGILSVLGSLAALPEVGVIEPCKLNPIAVEADGVIKVGRDIGIAAISWESVVRAFLQTILRLVRFCGI